MLRETTRTCHTVTDPKGIDINIATTEETVYRAPHEATVTVSAHRFSVETPLYQPHVEQVSIFAPTDKINTAIVEYIAKLHCSEPGGATETLARMAEAMGLSYDRPTTPEAEA